MQIICRGWLVLRLADDSPFALSVVMIAVAVPMTFLSLVGGALADRFPRKQILIATYAGNAIMTFILATLDSAGYVRFWHLIIIGVINGSLFAFNMPSRHSFISDIVPSSSLMNAIALTNSAMNISRVIGPALAGILILYIDTYGVFYLNSGTYLFSIFSILLISLESGQNKKSQKGMARDIREGIMYAKNSPVLKGLIIMLFVPALFGFPYQTLLPAWAREVLNVGSDELGFLLMTMGIGALIGSLILASLKKFKRRGLFLLIISMIWGICITIFAKSSLYVIVLPTIFIIGMVNAVFMSLNMTLLQLYSDKEMRGRIMSICMTTFGLMPLSAVPFGVIAERIGTGNSLFISGTLLIFLTLLFNLLNPKFRNIE
jgi:MFS family permease